MPKLDAQINFTIAREDREILEQIARAEERTLGAIVRRAVREFLARQTDYPMPRGEEPS